MTTEERLIQAIGEAKKIDVVYHGGSQPGAARQITPTGIRDGKVRAYCHTSQAMKLFAIDKISLVDSTEPNPVPWQPGLQPRYASIEELLNEHRNNLLGLGWHIECNPDHLSLHRAFKSGKPMKSADVSLDYEEFTHDLISDENGEIHEENVRTKDRPWTVRAKGKDTRTYGILDRASSLFLEWAGMLAPKR